MAKKKKWQFCVAPPHRRAVRKDGIKVTEAVHEMEVRAYFANKELLPRQRDVAEDIKEHIRSVKVWHWSGPEADFLPKLMEAKTIIKRIEAGELCGCNHWLTEKGCRFCRQCAVKELMMS